VRVCNVILLHIIVLSLTSDQCDFHLPQHWILHKSIRHGSFILKGSSCQK